ncbi:unnamed protein product [Musa acuminata var. zebrina]
MMRSASHPLVHQRAVISIRRELNVDQWCIEYPMLISDKLLEVLDSRISDVGLMRPLEKLIPDAISDQAKGLVILTAVNLGPVERMDPGFHHLPSPHLVLDGRPRSVHFFPYVHLRIVQRHEPPASPVLLPRHQTSEASCSRSLYCSC